MKKWTVKKRKLQLEEYQVMRETAGWNPIDDKSVQKALSNDLFSVAIYDEERLIGIGRVIGDGGIYYYIQDIIVIPEYQKRSVGRLIMDSIENYFKEVATTNAFIGLMAAADVKAFYHKFGYQERPDNAPGMYKVVKKYADTY